MQPLISVIVPVYQVAPYLKHCIESIINQTYHNLEILLVDDGSTDGSGEICDEYADKDSRIKVIHQENRGLSEARNRGIDTAKGKYVSFVDSDDWIDERFIKTMYEISVETGCDIVQCGLWNAINDCLCGDRWEGRYTIYSARSFNIASYTLLSWKCNVACNKLYKVELFDEIRYPAGKIHEDEFTTYKLIWKAESIAVINTKLYFYRRRTDSIMSRPYSLKRLDAGEAYREREKFYKERREEKLLNLTRKAHWEWIGWQISRLKDCEEDVEKIIVELKREKAYLEANSIDDAAYKKGLTFHGYLFPFAKVPYGSRIILYGAGDVGTQYYRQIMETNYCDVVAWVDNNASEYKELGFPVINREEMSWQEIRAEYFVIAINHDGVADKVMQEWNDDCENNRIVMVYEILRI